MDDLGGSGRVQHGKEDLGGSRGFWDDPQKSRRVQNCLGGSKIVWEGPELGGSRTVWEVPESSRRVQDGLGGFRMVWEGPGLFRESGRFTINTLKGSKDIMKVLIVLTN